MGEGVPAANDHAHLAMGLVISETHRMQAQENRTFSSSSAEKDRRQRKEKVRARELG